jgi:glycolate oxidase FAD binding subunit
MGTLGIISQMTLKVRPKPEASAFVWASFTSLESVGDVLEVLNMSVARPIALDLLSGPAAKLVRGPLSALAGEWIVIIGVEGTATSVRWQLERLLTEMGDLNVTHFEDAEAEAGWASLTEFSTAELGPISCVVSIRPSAVISFVKVIDSGRWAVHTHAGNGIVRLHALDAWTVDQAAAEIDRFRLLAERDGGSVILARCPTAWKSRLGIWGRPRPDWALAGRIKQALDPLGAFNPGRFVEGI